MYSNKIVLISIIKLEQRAEEKLKKHLEES